MVGEHTIRRTEIFLKESEKRVQEALQLLRDVERRRLERERAKKERDSEKEEVAPVNLR